MNGFIRLIACLLLLWANLIAAYADQAAEDTLNLLTVPQVNLERTSLVGDQAAKVAAITDGDAETYAEFDAGDVQTVDLVFSFADETVSPEAVVVRLASEKREASPIRIDVLVSTVSPRAGFKSLRTDPVDASKTAQKFAFRPSAARWIMIRLSVASNKKVVVLGEIEVHGRLGPPQTVYAFRESPARVIDILSSLETADAVSLAVSADEKRAFQEAKAGRLDPDSFADVALLASGVLDPTERLRYLEHIEKLAAKAEKALAKVRGQAKRGDALLQWLHRNVLTNGYRSTQTNLSTLLDSKTYNCVSSAVIYNILGLKLGLDVRAIEVPDHAFSIVYDGATHMDVETTTPRGFNPAREEIKEFERVTGFRYIPQSHQDQRREITEAGLAALIYYNRGVDLSHAKRHHDALLAYFRAMSLDPEFSSAAKNALASLANWSLELSEQRKWRQALGVATIGTTLAPADALLANNRAAVWGNWAHSLIDANQQDEALAVLRRAAEALPDEGFERMQAWVYIKPGEDLIEAQKWDAAFAAAEAGLNKLDDPARRELTEWRDTLFLRWANSEIQHGRFETAVSVLKRGIATIPNDVRLQDTVGYLGQEWARNAAPAGFSDGLRVLASLDRQFPDSESLSGAAQSYVWRQVDAMANAERIDEGLAAIDEAEGVLKDRKAKSELGAFLFDKVAKSRTASSDWEGAAKIYAQGLKRIPGNDLLENNVAYLAQEWQKAAYSSGGAREIAVVTKKLAALFPGMRDLARSGSNQIGRTVQNHVDAGQFQEALAVLKDSASQLTPQENTSFHELIYDSWAKARMRSGDWEEAADIYAAAVSAVGITDLIKNNIVYLAQEWQKAAYTAGGAAQVAAVTKKLAAKFPNISELSGSGGRQIQRVVNDHVRAGRFDQALAALKNMASQLTAQDKQSLTELIYDHWAKSRMQRGDWQQAADLYAEGLAAAGSSNLLRNNIAYLTQEWARAAFADGGVDALSSVIRKAQATFPNLTEIREVPGRIIAIAVDDKAAAGAFEDGLKLVEKTSQVLSPDKQRELTVYIYDRWARGFIEKKQWQDAVVVYDQGLQRVPESSLLRQNREYCIAQQR